MLGAHRLEQFQTSDPSGTCAVQHDFDVLDFLAGDVQRVQKTCGADHCCAVLVVVENGDVHFLFQALLDDETFGRFDVFEVDAAKGWPHQAHRIAERIGVFGVQFDIDRIHVGEAFEEDGFAFHHRLGGQCAKVAETKNSRAVRDDGDQVALVGVIIGSDGSAAISSQGTATPGE